MSLLKPSVQLGPVTAPADLFACRPSNSVVGLHYNPRYWGEDVKEYRPERFLEQYDKDAFVPFSSGPRACIGRRFTEGASFSSFPPVVGDT